MKTFDPKWRWALLLPLAIAVVWWSWADTFVVWLIMLAVVVRIGLLYHDDRRRAARATFTMVGVGTAIAVAMHLGNARMLDGYIQPAELLWSAWFYAGCMVLLEGLDRGLGVAVRRIENEATRSLVRIVVIVLVIAPAVVAIMQTVRPKVGYEVPPEVRAMEPIEFETRTADRVRIRGMYFGRGHDTTLVITHGLGAHSENFLPFLLPLLQDYPINGLIFDFRAHGRSDGHTSSFGYHEQKDLEAALAWLTEHEPQAVENLIFYGFSMGTAAMAAVAADTPTTRGVIVDSGFARLTDVAWAMAQQLPPVIGHYIYYTGLPLTSAMASAPLHRIEPVRDIERLEVPVRVLHGAADAMIPPEQGRELLERSRGTGRVIPGAGHTGLAEADPAYFRHVGRFIELLLDDYPPRTDPENNDDASPAGPLLVPPQAPQ